MPRAGPHRDLSLGLLSASSLVLPHIYTTSHPPDYTHLFAYFHFELNKAALLILLDPPEPILRSCIGHLLCMESNLLRASTLLQDSSYSQRQIHDCASNIFVVIRDALENISHLRYLEPRIHVRRSALQELRFGAIFNGCDRNFSKFARMNKDNFFHLVLLIREDSVFYNNSPSSQSPVEWQLLLTLCQLGLSGNGGSGYMIGHMFAMSEGSVHHFTKRCFEAILKLESMYVFWPDKEERNQIKKKIGQQSFFQDCVGFIDGTLIPLSFAPSKDPEDFWTRKHVYALNTLLICDHQCRIIYALHGWCGSAHDQRIYSSSKICQEPDLFFSEDEYILGDSGYTCSKNLIPTFKSHRLRNLDRDKKDFNKALSELRVAIEHANGMLKCRFQSLQDLRVVIRDLATATHATEWLRVCCILHNFGIDLGDHLDPGTEEKTEDALLPANLIEVDQDPFASYSRHNTLLRQFKEGNETH